MVLFSVLDCHRIPDNVVMDMSEYLWGWCEKDAQRDHYIHKVPILELWQADADALLNLPDYPFTVFRYSMVALLALNGSL